MIPMETLFDNNTDVTPAVLNTIAHLPTRSLPYIIAPSFWKNLSDADFMRITMLLAQKNYEEGSYPISAMIIDNKTRAIIGKSYKVSERGDDHYNHGTTSAVNDACSMDFSKTSMFVSLTPCDVCAEILYKNQFNRLVIGDITSTSGNEQRIKDKGIAVDIIEDQMGPTLYKKYKKEQLDL